MGCARTSQAEHLNDDGDGLGELRILRHLCVEELFHMSSLSVISVLIEDEDELGVDVDVRSGCVHAGGCLCFHNPCFFWGYTFCYFVNK